MTFVVVVVMLGILFGPMFLMAVLSDLGVLGGDQAFGLMILLYLIGGLALAWWYSSEQKKQEHAEYTQRQAMEKTLKEAQFPSGSTLLTPEGRLPRVYVNYGEVGLWVQTPEDLERIPPGDLLGISLKVNEEEVFNQDLATKAGVAALGGIAFGGVGAIVASLISQNQRRIQSVGVELRYLTKSMPKSIRVNFPVAGASTSKDAKPVLDEAQKLVQGVQDWQRHSLTRVPEEIGMVSGV